MILGELASKHIFRVCVMCKKGRYGKSKEAHGIVFREQGAKTFLEWPRK